MIQEFDWKKTFYREKDIAQKFPIAGHILAISSDPPFINGATHVVRFGCEVGLYHSDGKHFAVGYESWNLVNIPEKKVVERWVVLGSHGGCNIHTTAEYAQQTVNVWRNLGHEARIHHIREEF